MGKLINGRAIAEKINQATAAEVKKLKTAGIVPKLGIILVGNDPASVMYDRMKGEAAKRVGIDFILGHFPATITMPALIKKIKHLQKNAGLSGLIIQLPLPEHLYTSEVLNAIDPAVDVDFLTNENIGRLIMNTHPLLPPTPGAVLSVLEELNVNVTGKNIAIVGMGALVGKPLSIIMVNAGASVTTINSRTTNTKEKCLGADIIVTGVGKNNILRGDMVRPGAIVIDTGINFIQGKVSGDVNIDEVLPHASWVTPTPGGIGPITVARLLWNTVACAKKLKK